MARRRRGQFPIPKKEKGQWKFRYYTDQAQPDGSIRRVRKTKCLGKFEAMTSREARKQAQRFVEAINDVEPAIEHGDKTMNELIAKWRVAVKPTLKFSTQHNYEWAYARCARAFGGVPVAEIEKLEIQVFLTAASRDLSPESVHDLRVRLRGLLFLAEEWGWLKPGGNPAQGRFRLPYRQPVRPRKIPTPDQFRKLVGGLKQPYKALVALAGLSGLRRGELAALRWNDLCGESIRVDEAVYRGRLGSPKTRRSNRVVNIPPKATELLEEWRKECCFTQPEDFMFGIRTNTPIDLNGVLERVVKPSAEKLGLPRFSWHDFRHAYTTWGRQAGVEAEVMRDQVGHTSVTMTQDIYSHLDDRSGAAERIGAFVWPESGSETGLNGTPKRNPQEDLADVESAKLLKLNGRAAEI